MRNSKTRTKLLLAVISISASLAWPIAHSQHALGAEAGPAKAGGAQDRRKALDVLFPVNYAFYFVTDPLRRFVIKPIAVGYSYIIPRPARHAINNMQNNLLTPFSAVSNLLQGKVNNCGTEFARFGVNTTLGVLGLFEYAEPNLGLEPHPEDLGQTLGRWYIPEGPYLYVPVLGPSTLRDLPFILTMSHEAPEWYRGEKEDAVRFAEGLSIFMINGESLIYGNYDEGRRLAKEAGTSHYKLIRDNFVDRRYRKTKDLPPRR